MLKISQEIETLFLEKLQNLLENGETISHTTTSKRVTKTLNCNDELVNTKETTATIRRITLLPTPDYVMRMIDDSLSLDKAMEFLHSKGYVVIDPSIQKDSESSMGISDNVVQEIRRKLLGID